MDTIFFKRCVGILLSALLCFQMSCTVNSGYYLAKNKQSIITEKSSLSAVEQTNHNNNYYNSSSTRDNGVKPILVPEEKFYYNVSYSEFITLCNNRKYVKAQKMLGPETNTDSASIQYLRALTMLLRCQNAESLRLLKNVSAENMKVDVQLLRLDNEYELQKLNAQIDKKLFLAQYQALMDDKTISDDYKKIIETRVKYLRYR